jgi:hypothetical protein
MRAHLIKHAETNYDTSFQLAYSTRPWATTPTAGAAVTGVPGALWCVRITMRGRYLRVDDLWQDLSSQTKDLVVHLLINTICNVTATFAAADPADDVIAGIEDVFDSVITTSSYWVPRGPLDADPLDEVEAPDPRVALHSLWSQLDPVFRPPTVFDADSHGRG